MMKRRETIRNAATRTQCRALSEKRFVLRPSSFVLPQKCPGYTLLEMILVLAVLAAFASVSWPAMIHTYDNFRLKKAAEDVRIKLAGSRIHAIDSSLTYQFRYEPEGRWFVVLPYETEGGAGETFSDDEDAPPPNFMYSGQLPEEMSFRPDEAEHSTVRMPDTSFDGLPNASKLVDVNWSLPVLFYSDGSSTTTSLRVVNETKQFIRLSVRELTGTVDVARMQQEKQRWK